jgi:FtsH-binding integral membrane protein
LPYPFNDSYELNSRFLPSAFYWYVSVGLIILVHVVAVVLAHRHLSGATSDQPRARRSEYPWVVAMVAYTMLSLWLLAQPLVKESSTAKTAFHVSSQAAQAMALSSVSSDNHQSW